MATAGCWNVLVVAGSTVEEVAELIVLSAKAVCCVMLFEAAHTSDPSFDPAMVLFKLIIQVDARSVADIRHAAGPLLLSSSIIYRLV
jgi:hypothetical protein